MLLHYSIMIGVDIQWMLAMSSSTVLQLLARKHKNHQWYLVVHLVTIVCVCMCVPNQASWGYHICSVIVSCHVQFVCNQDLICELGLWLCVPTCSILYMFFICQYGPSCQPLASKVRGNTENTPSLALVGCGGGGCCCNLTVSNSGMVWNHDKSYELIVAWVYHHSRHARTFEVMGPPWVMWIRLKRWGLQPISLLWHNAV